MPPDKHAIQSKPNMTEQEYLNLAEDFKNKIEEKDKCIDYLKDRIKQVGSMNGDLRKKINRLENILKFLKSQILFNFDTMENLCHDVKSEGFFISDNVDDISDDYEDFVESFLNNLE
jgi:predicted nuclease with TOPRIM domain